MLNPTPRLMRQHVGCYYPLTGYQSPVRHQESSSTDGPNAAKPTRILGSADAELVALGSFTATRMMSRRPKRLTCLVIPAGQVPGAAVWRRRSSVRVAS